jgi:Endonuclease V (EC 3.1.21.-)
LESDFLIPFLKRIQVLISEQVRLSHLGLENVRTTCGADVAYRGDVGVAVVVCKGDEERVSTVKGKVGFPYIPGYLFMREAPIIMKALEGVRFDLLLVDGHGLAHPRRSGIATVMGVLLKVPTIGIAKSRLAGEVVKEGNREYLSLQGERVGVKVGRYYYSPGNLVDLDDVLELSGKGYPEVLREADRLSKKLAKESDE